MLRQISFCKLNLDNDIDTITNVKHTLYSDTIQGHGGCDGILTGPPGLSGGQKRSKANKDQEDNFVLMKILGIWSTWTTWRRRYKEHMDERRP